MPPRIRTRASKALKEDTDVSENKLKANKGTNKVPRKVLADKTNSASDDTSIEIPKKTKKTTAKNTKLIGKEDKENKNNNEITQKKEEKRIPKPKQKTQAVEDSGFTNEVRPRRDRRLPSRFVENPLLNNLSKGKDTPLPQSNTPISTKADNTPKNISLSKTDEPQSSPFKTPSKLDGSLLVNRPKRISRLPSRFEDHSISPNKYIPIQPANASTPIQQNKIKPNLPKGKEDVVTKEDNKKVSKDVEVKALPVVKVTRQQTNLKNNSNETESDKTSPDSNNNGKHRSTRIKRNIKVAPKNQKASPIKKLVSKAKKSIPSKDKTPVKSPSPIILSPSPKKKITSPLGKLRSPVISFSPVKKITSPLGKLRTQKTKPQSPIKKISPRQSPRKRLIDRNSSFKVLGGKAGENNKEEDPYAFTFDPTEDPQPQKKKRKRTVTKKAPSKPKTVVYKSKYEQNISKALAALKNAVKPGSSNAAPAKLTQITEEENVYHNVNQVPNSVSNINQVQNTANQSNVIRPLDDTGKTSVHEANYPSIRVEDIAADLEPSFEHLDNINYSPVNSPRPHDSNPVPDVNVTPATPQRPGPNNDPLNLQEELSFFDDVPVASSSMNVSVRHPLASPWRVEFGSLPIKWATNTYVKPNMTPAVERSFINSEDSNKKRHVYTNIGLEANEPLPEIANNNAPNLVQTSIISFIKEMAEKSAKKKRGRSVSPAKAIFEDIESNEDINKKKNHGNKEVTSISNTSNEVSNTSDNSKEEKRTRKRKNSDKTCDRPAKSPRRQKDKDNTYFGFDDSENQDENVSPVKVDNNPKGRSLRPRSRAVLQEINGPIRAALPASKTKIAPSSEVVNRVYEEMKSAADAPLFPETNVEQNVMTTDIEDPVLNEDSQSVHLFEDIDVVHHHKPVRKSYGKAKKVTFRQPSNSDSDTQPPVVEENCSSDYDDLADLTFEMPDVTEKKPRKKKKPKNLLSKKEEQEVEAWAANFNSMCEDVEEFPLIIE